MLADLHGLYTAEAIERTERAVREAQQQGKPELRVIVGKGLHSKDHVAHIKVRSAACREAAALLTPCPQPAIEKLMRDYNLSAQLDPHNSGVLVVHLGGGGGGTRDAGGFTRELAKQASGNEEQVSASGRIRSGQS